MANSRDYWKKRAVQRFEESEKYTEAQIKKINAMYNGAQRDLQKEIDNIYKNYGKSLESGGVFLDKQKLQTMLSKSESDKFWQSVEGKALLPHVKGNYKSRITRLESIKIDLYAKAKELGKEENAITTNALRTVLRRTHNVTIKDLGGNTAFATLDKKAIDRVLLEKWSGKNYSARIWGNNDKLAERFEDIITRGVMTGVSNEKMKREVRQAFGVSNYQAERLIRTEMNHIHNEADIIAYKEMGIESYVFLAAIDERTSEICKELDGQTFKVSEKETGLNFPPMHPNCRSTTIADLGEDERPSERRTYGEVAEWTTAKDFYEKREQGIIEAVGEKNTLHIADGTLFSNYGVNYDLKSLSRIDPDLMKANIQQLDDLLQDYPMVEKDLVSSGGMKVKDGEYKPDKYVLGYCMPDNSEIFLSGKHMENKKKHLEMVRRDIKSGHFMEVLYGNHDKYVVTHEFGHAVENYLTKHKKVTPDKAKHDIIEIAKKQSGKSEREIQKLMSKYGNDRETDFFAEAFAVMKLGSKDNIIHKAMQEYLKGVL